MFSACRWLSGEKHRSANEAMSDHERNGRPLLLGTRQELCRKIATNVTTECHKAPEPEPVEDGKQQQWVLWGFSQRFSLFDQQAGALHGRLSFGRDISPDMEERGYERDLKLDLLATQRRSGGQGGNLVQSKGDLHHGLNKRRALQRPLSGFAPPFDCRLGHASLGEVMRKQLRLGRGGTRKL